MSISEQGRVRISAPGIRSLCWCGDELVDFVGGGARYRLDGEVISSRVQYSYPFNRAVVSRDGEYAVIYEALGTQGLALRGTEVIRELNRSSYYAHITAYPVAIFQWPGGRTAVAHCPEKYNQIEIEDIETGERLVNRKGKAADIFHSRLLVTPDGTQLLSAGWHWHPWDVVALYNLADALVDPEVLNRGSIVDTGDSGFEANDAAFQGNEAILMAGDHCENISVLARYDLKERRVNLTSHPEEMLGVMMPLNCDYVVGFLKHPKLVEVASGRVLQRWPEIYSGGYAEGDPPLALDAERMRFAVADATGVTVIQLG
jgi:hypothetical protein